MGEVVHLLSRDHPWRNAFGFSEVQPSPDAPLVDQIGGRVFLGGKLFKAYVSESNAARVAAALQTLADLDALPCGRP